MGFLGQLARLGIVRRGGAWDFASGIQSQGSPVGAITAGDVYYLDPANGNDNNNGRSIDKAVATFAVAYAKLTANQNDVLYYISGATSLTLAANTTFVWAKNYTHLIGICAPVGTGNRARFFAGASFTPFMTVSATGCVFKNLSFFHGVASATALICGLVSGNRNYFENVRFAGIGNATQDKAGACSLELNTANENTFKNCVIGLETIGRGTEVNAELRVNGACGKNVFEDCEFQALTETNTHLMVQFTSGASGNGILRFKKCCFISKSVNNAIPMLQAISITSAITNYVILEDCTAVDIAAWDANNRGKVYVMNSPTPAADTAGISRAI